MKYKKCDTCPYRKRPQHVFPCTRCKENEQYPLTCRDCRYKCYENTGRKSLVTCKEFRWD
jgi:hypothetical protein